jgi:hypothetical protein
LKKRRENRVRRWHLSCGESIVEGDKVRQVFAVHFP